MCYHFTLTTNEFVLEVPGPDNHTFLFFSFRKLLWSHYNQIFVSEGCYGQSVNLFSASLILPICLSNPLLRKHSHLSCKNPYLPHVRCRSLESCLLERLQVYMNKRALSMNLAMICVSGLSLHFRGSTLAQEKGFRKNELKLDIVLLWWWRWSMLSTWIWDWGLKNQGPWTQHEHSRGRIPVFLKAAHLKELIIILNWEMYKWKVSHYLSINGTTLHP